MKDDNRRVENEPHLASSLKFYFAYFYGNAQCSSVCVHLQSVELMWLTVWANKVTILSRDEDRSLRHSGSVE